MTIRELQAIFRDYDPDTEVVIGYDYGDHSHRLCLETISHVRCETVTDDAYTQKWKVATIDDEETDDQFDALILEA